MPHIVRSRLATTSTFGSIETARIFALLLVVNYHVIGSGPEAGLQIDGPNPLRLFADFFSDLQIPLFAAISGYVYALKPVPRAQLWSFLRAKFHRLVLPGLVATTVFMLAAEIMGTRFAPDGNWLPNYVFPYAHFWFLQAILVVFIVVCSLDILLQGRFLWLFLLLACAASLSHYTLPTRFMSVNNAIYLLPYFLAGTLACRHAGTVQSYRTLIIGGALALVIAATWVNVLQFNHTGAFRTSSRDLQSLAFGLGGSALCLMLLPGIASRSLGAFGFTIYLYHVLGTSGMRRLLELIGADNLAVNLALGMLTGIGLPVILHVIAGRHPLTAWLILGQRNNLSRHKISKTTI